MTDVTHPVGTVILEGMPLKDSKLIETVTAMYAGRLVKKGTADHQIVVCGAGEEATGVLGYLDCTPGDRPSTLTTIYTAVWAPVLTGSNWKGIGDLATSQTITSGEPLTTGATGLLTAATVGTDHVYAYAIESVTTTTATAVIAVRWVL